MQHQSLNYYRFWLFMIGVLCIASIHGGFAFLAGAGAIALSLILPSFSGKIMEATSKIESKVNEKVAKKEAETVEEPKTPPQPTEARAAAAEEATAEPDLDAEPKAV